MEWKIVYNFPKEWRVIPLHQQQQHGGNSRRLPKWGRGFRMRSPWTRNLQTCWLQVGLHAQMFWTDLPSIATVTRQCLLLRSVIRRGRPRRSDWLFYSLWCLVSSRCQSLLGQFLIISRSEGRHRGHLHQSQTSDKGRNATQEGNVSAEHERRGKIHDVHTWKTVSRSPSVAKQ